MKTELSFPIDTSTFPNMDLADRDVGSYTGLFLQKPFSTKDFLRSVREVLENPAHLMTTQG